MKRTSFIAALGILCIGAAATSCGNNKTKEAAEDSAMVVQEMTQPAEPTDSLALMFQKQDSASYTTTASGLRYVVLKEGNGKAPSAKDVVVVNYEGKLLDGTVFDSTLDPQFQHNQPAEFPLSGVIKGWTEGLQLMKEGGKTIFYIPANLAYGETGTPGGPIPPNADLIFTVELLQVK